MKKLPIFQIFLFVLILIIGVGNFFIYKILGTDILRVQQEISSPAALSALGASQQESTVPNTNPGSVIVNVTPDKTAATMGDSSAKVTLVEFADFQCPFCDEFFKDTQQDIIAKYVQTGKVQFVFEDFPILGAESENAAEAAKCAQYQGQFWPYHDYLYANQKEENQGTFTIANLEGFAKDVPGLSLTAFNKCLDQHTAALDVHNELVSGLKYGVTGTPTIFINGHELAAYIQRQHTNSR